MCSSVIQGIAADGCKGQLQGVFWGAYWCRSGQHPASRGPAAVMVNEELADADGFGSDTVGTLMAKYDTDGSGSFNIQEYVPLARTNAIPPDSMDRPTALHCTGYAR